MALGLFALSAPVATTYANCRTRPVLSFSNTVLHGARPQHPHSSPDRPELSDSLPTQAPLVNKLVAGEPGMQHSSEVRVPSCPRKQPFGTHLRNPGAEGSMGR